MTLTREQIEDLRTQFSYEWATDPSSTMDELNALCDMALRSIAPPSLPADIGELVGRLKARAFRLATRDMNGDGAALAKEAADALESLAREREEQKRENEALQQALNHSDIEPAPPRASPPARERDDAAAPDQVVSAREKLYRIGRAAYALDDLASDVLKMCRHRGWSLDWTHRGAYLHLEASELIEAIRDKHGDPKKEAADVLLVLMSITEYHGIPWHAVESQARNKCDEMMVRPRYPGEEHDGSPLPEASTPSTGGSSQDDAQAQQSNLTDAIIALSQPASVSPAAAAPDSVGLEVYEAAVKGRQQFRAAYSKAREALIAADAAINPPDRGGISMAEWNKRLQAATATIREVLTTSTGGSSADNSEPSLSTEAHAFVPRDDESRRCRACDLSPEHPQHGPVVDGGAK